IVGPRAVLATDAIDLRDVNWVAVPGEGRAVQVKVRSTMPAAAATVQPTAAGARGVFAAPQYGVAPGQAGVLYDGERGLGGGWSGGGGWRGGLGPAAPLLDSRRAAAIYPFAPKKAYDRPSWRSSSVGRAAGS